MASDAVDIATGITIVFGTTGFTANIQDVSGPGLTRESIDVSHQGTVGGMEFLPGDLHDPGELTFDIQFNPDTNPPVDQPIETVTITWPSGATWAADGFMTNYEPAAPLDDKMTGSVTVKFSGDVTITPAA